MAYDLHTGISRRQQQSAELLSLSKWDLLAQFYGELVTFKHSAIHNE
ncbi:hypothetical protein L9G74_01695 [Shewanella sp. C32]|uniref:Uncharacterized protein n=1 Tax=Shewanella electrica TaxID=515560 RepID=A0ABT2FFS7_9GAMM|nr:hypothetical protein [Shewanella electrica]MCH1925317.1 hypothetical protein [Shewanella electrica]MCS4555142.1 hypothetical protein [Shewanella electrica]